MKQIQKRRLWISLIFLWLELAFHLYMKLDMSYTLIFGLFALSAGLFGCGFFCLLPRKAGDIAGCAAVGVMSLLFLVECICRDILQQYFQIFSAAETAAGNKLTDFASTVGASLLEHAVGILILLILPVGVSIWCTLQAGRKEKDTKEPWKKRAVPGAVLLLAALVFHGAALGVVFLGPWKGEFSPKKLYRTDTSPGDQVEQLGVITMLRLDIRNSIFGVPEGEREEIKDVQEEEVLEEMPVEYEYNCMDIDFSSLAQTAPSEDARWLGEYFQSLTGTKQNEYTGMFEGYNVIFITAEGFSGYMIDPELTPVLYRLSQEGFVFRNFYSALHFTSTSGGEFQNLTGLYPKNGFPVSMSETGKQGTYLPFTLANQLNRKGYTSIGYHFNQNMYGRELSHPNLGYDWRQFTQCSRPLTGETDEYGNTIWPQSDDYMIEQTFGEYKDLQPFHVYYLTISGHLPYSFGGSQMSLRNQELVQNLPYSEKTKAYLAANLELEKGLARLVEYLEEEGIADKTVIALAPDHIPYSDLDVLEELAGKSFNAETLENLDERTVDLDVYRNTCILWSASMEEPVEVETPCSQVDILPTLSNLLGLEYDSRILAGTDVLSGSEPVVIFSSHSWLTGKGSYNRYSGVFTPAEGVEMSEEETAVYVENINYLVSCRTSLGQLIIENDYYRQALE